MIPQPKASLRSRATQFVRSTGSPRHMAATLLSVLITLTIGGALILVNGDNPFVVYWALLQNSFGSATKIANTLAAATPLIFTGLAVGMAFRAGVWNIGAEGQLYMGAIAGAVVGVYAGPMWSPAHVPLSLAAGMLCGGLWAYLMGYLKVKWDVDEVVTTTMGNYIAILFTSYLVNYPLKPERAPIGSTHYIAESAQLPQLFSFSTLNAGFLLALVAAAAYWIFFKHTAKGFEMRTSGLNASFSRYIGIRAGRQVLWAMFASGALAGLAGCVEVLGVQWRFVQDMSPNYGFDGVLVTLLAMNRGPGIVIVAILFGALRSGGIGVEQLTNVPSELSVVLTSLVILFVSSRSALVRLIWRKEREAHA